ncbi:MAG: hypothetical protein ACR2NU_00990, partial [Aeoliella sp.]
MESSQPDNDYHTKLNPRASAKDARLIRRATREKWDIPDEKREELPKLLCEAVSSENASMTAK